jgi:hypothetical protein
MRPLKIPIPLDYAPKLGVHQTFLTHVNHGRRRLNPVTALRLLDLADGDPRVDGLTLQDLRPEAAAYRRHFKRQLLQKIKYRRQHCACAECPIFDLTNWPPL